MTAPALLNLWWLALCVWREARGESLAGKALVAQVIINRSKDAGKRWPRTIQGVVRQPLQFSSFNKSDPNSNLYPVETDASWVESVVAAEQALAANPPLTLANHYLTTALFNSPGKPAWAVKDKVIHVEGNHAFLLL